jgi:uncharacterized protein YdeI (YjbR/CyaY-like superfamily)
MKPKFFKSPVEFREWLQEHHDKSKELFVGFYKKSSGKKSITYPEALEEALCFGWIDGVRKKIDAISYSQRFSPRKPKSIWSLINVRHVERLKSEGRMHSAGLEVYALREDKRTGIYSFENRPRELSPEYQKVFQKNKKAWEFFKNQPPYYQRTLSFWVMGAKREETQLRRLQQLIESSAAGKRHGLIDPKAKRL